MSDENDPKSRNEIDTIVIVESMNFNALYGNCPCGEVLGYL
jgi:hypothetical protein